jgi:type VII secretion integral membrane protein EccD
MVADVGQDVRRVSLHTDGHTFDLSLPAAVPIAEFIPSILDLLRTELGSGAVAAAPVRYQLSCPGTSPFDLSTTLSHNSVRNGALLFLTRSSTELPAPSFDDAADAVSTTLADAARPWSRQCSRLASAIAATWLAGPSTVLLVRRSFCGSGFDQGGVNLVVAALIGCVALLAAVLAHRVYREPVAGVTLGLLATGFAAVAGFLAVPDGPGPPNALLSAMAASVVAALTMRLTGCGDLTFTAVSCLALVIAVAAVATVLIGGPLLVMGSLTTLVSLALLEVSARLSITWAGLSPSLPTQPDDPHGTPDADKLRRNAVHADGLLTSLVVGFSGAAAVGAVCTVISAYATDDIRSGAVLFAAVTGAVLLLRARSHPGFTRTLTLLVTGTVTLSAAFAVAGAASQHPVWLVTGIALPVAVAMCLGFVVPALTLSPAARRGTELLEYLALIAIVPLACWTCGFYSAARGVHLI